MTMCAGYYRSDSEGNCACGRPYGDKVHARQWTAADKQRFGPRGRAEAAADEVARILQVDPEEVFVDGSRGIVLSTEQVWKLIETLG